MADSKAGNAENLVQERDDPVAEDSRAIDKAQEALVLEESMGDDPKGVDRNHDRLMIVGIGASAGGLEAIESFFQHMDPDSGMAFVVVQHLDPTHKSILSELVGRFTKMPVQEAKQAVDLEPNQVYIIPPNRDLAILNNRLQLMDPTGPRHLRLSIDYFFRSLAQEAGEQSVGIVLSGTGTDGTLGIRAIKGEGGLVLVQDPNSSAYDGMPRSAIATGLVDAVLAPGEMARQLMAYTQQARYPAVAVPSEVLQDNADDRERLFVLLRAQTSHDFSLYKEATITRRIQRRMTLNSIESEADYVWFLQQSPAEIDALWKEFLIPVTHFFRDPEVFELLAETVIPELLGRKNIGEQIRIWVPACSTGEEAYSIALLMREHLDRLGMKRNVQIFATDIDQSALETARAGIYPESIVTDVSPGRLRRFFSKTENTYVAGKELRSMLVFSSHNVVKDPPFSRTDLISCRNLLIYMKPELQARVLSLFHYSLDADGFLLLGTSETTSSCGKLFKEENRKLRLYRRSKGRPGAGPRIAYAGFSPGTGLSGLAKISVRKEKTPTLREATESALLEAYAPTCVIVDTEGDVRYAYGQTERYLEAIKGEASLNILQLVRQELRLPLSAGLREALVRKEESCYRGLPLQEGQERRSVDIRVRPFPVPNVPHAEFMVLFEDSAPLRQISDKELQPTAEDRDGDRVTMLEQELASTREVLQTANEELQTSNEELGSTVEELQSTNEELLTSQEELRSVNEELLTVNAELESKVEELADANSDKENLLASTDIGTVFLDLEQNVKWFSPTATRVVNLIESDLGRPLSHISHGLRDIDLSAEVEGVLDTLEPFHREVRDDTNTWYDVRITLYRMPNHAITGAVISLVDITERKLAKDSELFRNLLDSAPDATIVTDDQGEIVFANTATETLFGWKREDLAGRPVEILMPDRYRDMHREQRTSFMKEPRARAMGSGRILTCRRKDGSEFHGEIALSPLKTERGTLITSAVRDMSVHWQMERALQRANGIFRSMCQWIDKPVGGDGVYPAMQELCDSLVAESGYRQCWIGLEGSGGAAGHRPVVHAGFPNDGAGVLDPDLSRMLREKGQAVIRHIRTDREHAGLWAFSEAWGFESLACLPLIDNKDRIGVLVLHDSEPAAFDEVELEWLEALSRRLSSWCFNEG